MRLRKSRVGRKQGRASQCTACRFRRLVSGDSRSPVDMDVEVATAYRHEPLELARRLFVGFQSRKARRCGCGASA